MKGAELTRSPSLPAEEVVYPDRDGEPMAETGVHILVLAGLIVTLRLYFARRRDMYIIGNMFLYYEEGRPASRGSPDVMVVKGVGSEPERRSFKIWEEGATPCVIFEITSKETADEDVEIKRELYERLGVAEYFLFDPLHEYLEQPLLGYRPVSGKYEPLIPAGDGGLLSVELGIRLVPEGQQLALYETATGNRVPAPPDWTTILEQAQNTARQAEEQARQAEEQRRQEQQRAEQMAAEASRERQRAEELEREVARLRTMLPPEALP